MTKKDGIFYKEVADFGRQERAFKKQKLCNNEYYDMQSVFDKLYAYSENGKVFCSLVEIMKQPETIILAYRNIRKIVVVKLLKQIKRQLVILINGGKIP